MFMGISTTLFIKLVFSFGFEIQIFNQQYFYEYFRNTKTARREHKTNKKD